MKKKWYVVYGGKSNLTGRLLFNCLKERFNEDDSKRVLRKNKRPDFKENTEVVIRYGTTNHPDPEGVKIFNKIDAVEGASNKVIMANLLLEAEGVNFPLQNPYELDPDEMYFVRCKDNVVRYLSGSDISNDDKYVMFDVNKDREFRVHVAFGRTVGVYEKLPKEGYDDIIRKNDNCDFRRIDQAVKGNVPKGVRPMAVKANEALGLDFSGVDVMIDTNGKVWVNEVNSSPGLSEKNCNRLIDKILEEMNKDQEEEPVQDPVEEPPHMDAGL